MVDKLSKALEGLKNIQFTTAIEDTTLRKKEKMIACDLVADLMVSLKLTTAQNLPQLVSVMVETLIHLCDDKDSDVRMVADESLNRVIRALSETNMLKVQIELHKEIKKNGPARCLRAALWRFGQLSNYIRPYKGRGHFQSLFPSLLAIAKRPEESIHETLSTSLVHIFKVLGVFTNDNEIKSLLKVFLHNLSSNNAVIRRTSATSIITVIQYCRKPHVFNSFVLNTLIDCVVPICEENSTFLVLGVLCCLRMLLPHLTNDRNDDGIEGSFGLRKKPDESLLSVDRLIQIYEVCLHYTNSKDHNVVTAALETLNQLLQNPPQQLESFLLSPAGFSRSYIHSSKDNKLWMRSSSESSVACSMMGGDESLLLDDIEAMSPFTSITNPEPGDSKQSVVKSKEKFTFSEDDIKMVDNPFKDRLLEEILEEQVTPDVDSDTESVATSDVNDPFTFLLRSDTKEKERVDSVNERSRSNSRDDLSTIGDSEVNSQETLDVGSFTDPAVPLVYCSRHLAASFLLDGSPEALKSDRAVRVSVKSLVFSCLSAIVKLYPVILKMELVKNHSEGGAQEISDVLLFSGHSDPQIRGAVNMLIGSFLNTVVLQSKGVECDWLTNEHSKLNFNSLLGIIFQGLKDKSSVCTRQALSALKLCVNSILFSVHYPKILPLLHHLPSMSSHSYWLVKVKLVEVLSELPYLCISDIDNTNHFQESVIDGVLLPLLGDEDARVRLAASESIVKIIPLLYYGNSTVLDYSKTFSNHFEKRLKIKKQDDGSSFYSNPCPPFSHIFENVECDKVVDYALSRVIAKLTSCLLVAFNKYSVFGYVEALKLLSEQYPPTIYLRGWNCMKFKKANDGLNSSLLELVLSLLVTSPIVLDLAAYSNATILLGNLFAGHCICNLKNDYQVAVASPTEGPSKFWNVFKNSKLSQIAEQMITHVLKTLHIYSHLLEESKVGPSSNAPTTLLPLSLPSPIKKQERKTDKDEKSDERKPKNFNTYRHSPQYFKLYRLLKNAYTNYKISLEASVSDKFLDLLESTINVLSILLEVGTVQDTGRFAEDILSYLKPAVSLRPSPCVICVVQLLKSLFGINLASNWEEPKFSELESTIPTLFGNIYEIPFEFLLERIRSHAKTTTLESENLDGSRRRTDRKLLIKNTDKNCLAMYIRLFEPMVIKSLKLYTISSDVILQSNVLRLLNQLVQLRVNYCLLDSDENFINFVLRQFELIEQGQIPGIENLLPDIFKFLVLLSYEKHHSKSIMSVPKIIQLCDGLMASDQPTLTHCIPALIPIVEDVFLSRSLTSSTEQKELETQRDVLLAKVLRLIEFPQVMDILSIILNESRNTKERERWKRWSGLVMDAILPSACQGRLRIETEEGQESFSQLMSSLSPNVLRPIDPLLRVLFVEPHDFNCLISLKRWMSRVSVMLEIILLVKEDVLLNRVEDVAPNLNLCLLSSSAALGSPDPFNVRPTFKTYESPETFARFLLKVIHVIASKLVDTLHSSFELHQQLSVFFVSVLRILSSGTFHRITNSLQALFTEETAFVDEVSSMFVDMMNLYPILTCQFSYFLALLNHCDRTFWDRVLRNQFTLPSKLVQYCGIITLSDYLCENLSDVETLNYLLQNNIQQMILLSNETPMRELLPTMHLRAAESNLLIQAISSKCTDLSNAHFVEKCLRVLEIAEYNHIGPLIFLLVKKFLLLRHFSLSRLGSSLACRRVEFLLTLPPDKVKEQMDKDMFVSIMDFMIEKKLTKRHSTLVGLLNKLSTKVYDLSPFDLNQSRAINPQHLKNIKVDEEWYFTKVKHRCCKETSPGREMASLLSKLSYDQILEIMSCKDFSVVLLKDFLLHRSIKRRKKNLGCFDSSNDALFEASKKCLLELINGARKLLPRFHENKKYYRLVELCEDEYFYNLSWKLAPSFVVLLNELNVESSSIGKEYLDGTMKFTIFILEVIAWHIENDSDVERLTKHKLNQNILEIGLKCCEIALKNPELCNHLSLPINSGWLKSCIRSIYLIVCHLIPPSRISSIQQNERYSELATTEEDIFQLEFLLLLIFDKSNETLFPKHLGCIRNVIINVCRIPEVSTRVLKVPESNNIQDIELLQDFISRFSILGWTNRQQFEEIWVALLSVLGFNTQGNTPPEETAFIVQASTAAVEAISTLLSSTLLDPVSRRFIHHGRDTSSMRTLFDQLPILSFPHESFDNGQYHFLDNLEFSKYNERYQPNLLSIEYIWTAVKQINSNLELYVRHSGWLNEMGIDVRSCVHLLIELYSQWVFQSTPDIRIICATLRSAIVMSDLFTDIGQYHWLLDFCLHINQIVMVEDITILPMIILGSCKAVAVVLPDLEVCEKIKRLMLRSSSVPCKIATVQGLLYLLQSPILCSVVEVAHQKDKSNFQQEESSFVSNIMDMFFPVALDIVQQFKSKTGSLYVEYERCCWSLVFYLLEHYQKSLGKNAEDLLTLVLTALREKTCSEPIFSLLVRGTERLILTSIVDEKILDKFSEICLDMIAHTSTYIYRNGLQLLMVLSFLEKRSKDIRQSVMGQEDPERIMRGMEKVNILFEKLKKSYPDEAEVVGDVIFYILSDFAASDILTKVIQEFLSPTQPHLKILSGLLFKVFERAEIALLEDWVVFSLPSFTQGLPMATSIWTLNCFFASASKEPWLRSMFPLVQSRLRMVEVEDKKLLCLSASRFYNQLKEEKQKMLFVKTFENAAKINSVFLDLLSTLN